MGLVKSITVTNYGIVTAVTAAAGIDVPVTGALLADNNIWVGQGAGFATPVSFAANTFPARASTGNLVAKDITDFGLSLVDDASAAAALATLGGTTVGISFFTVANPGAIRFPRVNADNTVTLLDDAAFLAAIGGGGGGDAVIPAGDDGDVMYLYSGNLEYQHYNGGRGFLITNPDSGGPTSLGIGLGADFDAGTVPYHLTVSHPATDTAIVARVYENGGGPYIPTFAGALDAGTYTAGSQVVTDDAMVRYSAIARGDTTWQTAPVGGVYLVATEDQTDSGNCGRKIVFRVVENAAGLVETDGLELDHTGNAGLGDAAGDPRLTMAQTENTATALAVVPMVRSTYTCEVPSGGSSALWTGFEQVVELDGAMGDDVTGNGAGLWSFRFQSDNISDGDVNSVGGVIGQANHRGSGTATNVLAFDGYVSCVDGGGDGTTLACFRTNTSVDDGGDVTNNYGLLVQAPVVGTGTIDTNVGVRVSNENTADVDTAVSVWSVRKTGAANKSHLVIANSLPSGDHTIYADLGTLTDPVPFTEFIGTWNDGSDTFIAHDTNVTVTAAAAASRLQRWRTGGTERAAVGLHGWLYSAMGQSSSLAKAIGQADSQTSAAGVGNGADTTDDTLHTLSLAINALSEDGKSVWLMSSGTFAANGQDKQVKHWFAGTAVADSGVVTSNAQDWVALSKITRVDATHVSAWGIVFINGVAQIVLVTPNLVVADLSANASVVKTTGASPTSGSADDVLGYSQETWFAN